MIAAGGPALFIRSHLPQTSTRQPRSFTIGTVGRVGTLDPAETESPAGQMISDNIFQPLLRLDAKGNPTPVLAASASSLGTSVTVRLKPSLHLANGSPLTDQMVAASLARPLYPSVHSPAAAALLAQVVGAGDVQSGKSRELSGVQSASGILTIQLTSPVGDQLVKALANPALSIVPVNDMLQGGPYWQRTNLYGTGPWTLSEWAPGDHLVFNAAKNLSGPGSVTVQEYDSASQAELGVVNGNLDMFLASAADVAALPASELKWVRYLPGNRTLSLYYPVASTGSIPLKAFDNAMGSAFRGLVKSEAPSGVVPVHIVRLGVDGGDPEALAVAKAFARGQGGRVQVVPLASSALSPQSAPPVDAYLGHTFPNAQWASIALMREGKFWMVSPRIAAYSGFGDGLIRWDSVRWRK